MLTVTFLNKSGPGADVADYEVTVWVNRHVIAREEVFGHRRSEGWRELVKRLVFTTMDRNIAADYAEIPDYERE
jgi:hypothetical protein